MKLTARSTKAEILAAYNEISSQPTTWQDVAEFVSQTAQTFVRELILFGQDCYRLGRFCRRCVNVFIDTYAFLIPGR